jgi:hypothetical protein
MRQRARKKLPSDGPGIDRVCRPGNQNLIISLEDKKERSIWLFPTPLATTLLLFNVPDAGYAAGYAATEGTGAAGTAARVAGA